MPVITVTFSSDWLVFAKVKFIIENVKWPETGSYYQLTNYVNFENSRIW